ncbi:signal transduction histidine kinase [Paenibacillus shirakamiensis]|uniref:Signal transduction histidine kinase n=1 Tax=Paenibacillus shirakamiensis TaxID=1265935 RepID=A0ABS4JGG8_9BACL|nr:hypothetical protein [Paenibacillus shirakamiensis]MBP2000820.1 signal transduction histidine kinase [Paenibacillus shirakamiensis]
MGELLILFVVIALASILFIGMLLAAKDAKWRNIAFVLLVVMAILITFMNFTALPSNETTERMVAIVFGLLAVIGMLFKFRSEKVANMLVTASVVLGMLQMFFF